MRKIIALFVGIIFIVLIIFGKTYLSRTQNNQPTIPTPSHFVLTPTISSEDEFCKLSDLKAQLETEGAAGSIYGTFTITNKSSGSCTILGDTYISGNFNKSVTNLVISHVGTAQNSTIKLAAGKALYSQMRYPNGPQCSDGTRSTNVTFSYAISPSESIEFINNEGLKTISIPTCQKKSEVTTIQLWNVSTKPITQ